MGFFPHLIPFFYSEGVPKEDACVDGDYDDGNGDDGVDGEGKENACEGAICTSSSEAGDGWIIMLDPPTIKQNAFQMGAIANAYKAVTRRHPAINDTGID